MPDILDILSQAGRSARDIAMIKAGLLRQNASQNAGPMARGVEEGLIGEGADMARAGVGALGDAYGAGDGALDALLSGYTDRMAKARARAAALRAQSPEAFEYGEKLPERLADAAGLIGVAGHVRMPELPRIGPGAAPELAFARTGGEMPAMRMPEAGPKPISRAGEPLELEQRAYHGTHVPNLEKFDLGKIGSGEGEQAYGWGGYFAEDPRISEWYRETVADSHNSNRQIRYTGKTASELGGKISEYLRDIKRHLTSETGAADARDSAIRSTESMLSEAESQLHSSSDEAFRSLHQDRVDNLRARLEGLKGIEPSRLDSDPFFEGSMYKFDIPENSDLLDYDAMLSDQRPGVLEKLKSSGILRELAGGKMALPDGEPINPRKMSGETLYGYLAADEAGGQRHASEILRSAGIPGLRYLDAGSRGGGVGGNSHNFVIWDEARIGKPEPTAIERELQLMAGGE